ncbi:hypothetical protein GCM10010246_30800 [Streptomyces cuspidosporus]|uniref:Uncharacterized protein n=1 Tax=Streptomyces cuspidosporus TaxID=66882 RepID=A0ABP5T0Z1_9ACTN
MLGVKGAVLDETPAIELVHPHLELLAGHAERGRERTLREGDTDRGRGSDARHHDNRESLPSGPATSLGLHDFPPSRTYISGWGRDPSLGWEKCYVLGKESAHVSQARTAPETPAITPERQPLATPSRNLLDRPCRKAETPLSTAGATAAGLLGGDPSRRPRRPVAGLGGWTELGRSWSIDGRVHKGFVTSE